MHLAEMGPNVHMDIVTDLGSRDKDRNHNWTNDAQQNYSNKDLSNAIEFVHKASGESTSDVNDTETETRIRI